MQKISVMALVCACALSGAAFGASVTIDGTFDPAEGWGAVAGTVTETNSSGALPISIYWQTDSQYVYGAMVADTSAPGWATRPGNFANVYVYSSALVGGTLGDGNDVIIQTTSDWLTGDSNLTNPVANITDAPVPAGTALDPGDRDTFTQNGTVYTSDGGLVTVGWAGGNTNVIEFQIDKSVLNYNASAPYTNFRVGVQGWSYDLSPAWPTLADPNAGGGAAVAPVPASVWSGGALMAVLGGGHLVRRRRQAQVV